MLAAPGDVVTSTPSQVPYGSAEEILGGNSGGTKDVHIQIAFRSGRTIVKEAPIYSHGRAGAFALTGQGATSVVGQLPIRNRESNMRKYFLRHGLVHCVLALLAIAPAHAERSQDFGDYVVHFNAVSTNFLAPEVAGNYGIRRSPSQALINVAVLKKVMGTTGQPVEASVSGTASNLTGQQTALTMRQIREGRAIYYIDTFRVSNGETLNFELDITPAEEAQSLRVVFRQQFFTQ